MSNTSETIYYKIACYLLELIDEVLVINILNKLDDQGDDEKLTLFESGINKLEEYVEEISLCQANSIVFVKMPEVIQDISIMKEIYLEYESDIDIEHLMFLLNLSSFILSGIEDIETHLDEIIHEEFTLQENLHDGLCLDCNIYECQDDFSKSMAFFYGVSSIEDLISSGLTIRTAYLLIGMMKDICNIRGKSFFISRKNEEEYSRERSLALLKLFYVCSGQKFHNVRVVGPSNFNDYLYKIDHSLNYQQFSDSLIILSEYNGRRELLNKYMSLYHMLENFTFKYPLVLLNLDKGGRMFSIRDFRDMYNKVDDGELSSLEKFFKDGIANYDNGSLIDGIFDDFKNLNNSIPDVDINHVFSVLNLSSKSGLIKADEVRNNNFKQRFPSFLAKLIYIVRNAIVHNKETEFHLSHETLDDRFCLFIERYLMPQLEKVLLSLLVEKNNVVWYEHQNIRLFA